VGLLDKILGRPLKSSEAKKQELTVVTGVPVLGLDALASTAYGPEAALMILVSLSVGGLRSMPIITLGILVLLAALYFSYRQTAAAYPDGGGAYIVAKDNLGMRAGVIAGTALLLDYILNVAVGISAGVGAALSAIPGLQHHRLPFCLLVLVVLTFVNLRGVKESGLTFAFPVIGFVACVGSAMVIGVVRALLSGGHPLPVQPPPPVPSATEAVGAFIPSFFAERGRRLVFSSGIIALAILAGLLLIAFAGITDKLIPLFAIGAFSAFSLSQIGMVAYWRRKRGKHARTKLTVNAVGATMTCIALMIIIAAKSVEGAWVTLIVGAVLVWVFWKIKHHYEWVAREIDQPVKLQTGKLRPPVVIIPIDSWNAVTERALRFGMEMSDEITALHATTDEEDTKNLRKAWIEQVEEPARAAKAAVPRLEIVKSPYRQIYEPVLKFVRKAEKENKDRLIAVIIPELVEPHWYEHLLHNLHGPGLRARLFLEGEQRTVVITTPWYLREK
jgi:amino acid transporter